MINEIEEKYYAESERELESSSGIVILNWSNKSEKSYSKIGSGEWKWRIILINKIIVLRRDKTKTRVWIIVQKDIL